jgi:peptide-methionine (R)-S-oxide reductase
MYLEVTPNKGRAMMVVSKRDFLAGVAASIGGMMLAGCSKQKGGVPREAFEIVKSEDEWRAVLTPAQFRILRQEGTEPAGSSPLNAEKRAGIYACAGCDLPVYTSETKYESGTGWPSFTAPIEGATRTKPDPGLFGERTEVHCRRCGGHLGHVFDDGPAPTGQRWCMNGLAMTFRPRGDA